MSETIEKTEECAAHVAETSLVLRVCRADGTSRPGFAWPDQVGAEIVAPDWSAVKECGHGLHGWLYGQGDHSCVDYWRNDDARWYVLEVRNTDLVMLGGKCKFPRAIVRFIGSMREAAAFIRANETKAQTVAVIGAEISVGDRESCIVGSLGTATAGNGGAATAGDSGTATAGYGGTATAGDSGTATAGNRGTATAGNRGTATAGNRGAATAGDGGTATAGDHGEIRIRYRDTKSERYRTVVGYVGEDGIKPNVKYRLNADHKFSEEP
ncbi:DUF7666 domain-containing protein [Gluconacetobacter diazotrophicus]|uniref:DUF7666 domain-containing protein n=1 Tax=Gluconacetobacter diazotrophicus TaxID=33996 RepID=UPI00119AF237|nr:hypothetical protein [Gluconacetobacter diazotrophicus]TWB00393.1 hypothetical protein FBZ86_1377 [Gluconacetobacter diazotrophicus]